jgi:hypothetical protein
MDQSILNIYDGYNQLLKNYTTAFYKNLFIKLYKNKKYLEYIFIKGQYIIKNIFTLALIYYDNITEVYNITEKGYVYFIEFIIQINLNSYNFELSIKDAIVFSYKKTIINNKITHDIGIHTKYLNITNVYIDLINNLFLLIDINIDQLYNNAGSYVIDDDENIINDKISDYINNKFIKINKLSKKIINNIYDNNTEINIKFINELNNYCNNIKDKTHIFKQIPVVNINGKIFMYIDNLISSKKHNSFDKVLDLDSYFGLNTYVT